MSEPPPPSMALVGGQPNALALVAEPTAAPRTHTIRHRIINAERLAIPSELKNKNTAASSAPPSLLRETFARLGIDGFDTDLLHLVADLLNTTLPVGWQRFRDASNGRTYYHHGEPGCLEERRPPLKTCPCR